jgi:hypothetical protein
MESNSLIEFSRARFDHESARRSLREKYQAKLTFAANGGLFRACPEMISFLNLYGEDTIIIEDLYQNPVQVNAKELNDAMKARWQEQMNAWLVEYQNLNQQR